MDILKWAVETTVAKDAKFTPLSKNDQLAIAEFIVSVLVASTDAGKNQLDDMEGVPSEPHAKGDASAIPDMEGVPSNRGTEDETMAKDEKEVNHPSTRRVDLFMKCGMDAQAAYDKFIKWADENPCEHRSFVIDFATGQKSVSAAFAYWLNEMVEVDE